MYIYRLAVSLIFALTVIVGKAAESLPLPGSPEISLPPYVRLVETPDDMGLHSLPDSVYYRIAGRVIFKVNRTEMRADAPLLSELADSVLPYANRMGWMLVGIDLRGAASPEGPYLNNVRLSKGRAAALGDFLRQHLDSVQIDEIYTQTIAEDYAYLLWQLERAGDSAAPHLQRFIDARGLDNPAAIKSDLQALYGGTYWTRLLTDYFPHIRAARVVLYFRPVLPSVPAPEPQSALTDPVGFPEYVSPLKPLWTGMLHYVDRPHMLSVSSNLLYDAFYMPRFGWAPMWNIAAEWFPRGSAWTLRAQFTSPYYHRWNRNKFFQIRDYHLEVRRYFNPGRYHTGLYAAAYANVTKYGIGLGPRTGWQGEGYGGALKLGYVARLAHRWRLDFHIAAGGFITRYDPYVYGNPITGAITGDNDEDYYYDWTGSVADFHRRNHRFSWFGPTEIGVSLTYDLLYYRLRRPGASFLSREPSLPF